MSDIQTVETIDFLIFMLNEQRYALKADFVEVVVRMVEIISMPGAPEFVSGVINFRGDMIPVIDLRMRLGMPTRSVSIYDHLIIISSMDHYSALIADSVCEVMSFSEKNTTEIATILPNMPFISGIARLPGGIILLNNPEVLFSYTEMQVLETLSKQDNLENDSLPDEVEEYQ